MQIENVDLQTKLKEYISSSNEKEETLKQELEALKDATKKSESIAQLLDEKDETLKIFETKVNFFKKIQVFSPLFFFF